MRHLQVLSRLAWRQGFQSNRPGPRQSGEAVQVDVILFVNWKAESVAMAAMPGSHNSKERGARDLPQDVEGPNMMQLLWSSSSTPVPPVR